MSEKKKTPQPGEAWLVEVGGEEAEAILYHAGDWLVKSDRASWWVNPGRVTPLRRLVPEREQWETLREAAHLLNIHGLGGARSTCEWLADVAEAEHEEALRLAGATTLIEKAARVVHEAETGSPTWDDLTPAMQKAYLDVARNLRDAGLLRAVEVHERQSIPDLVDLWDQECDS